MKFIVSAIAILAIVSCCTATSDDPIVNVKQGTIIGKRIDFVAKELDVSVDAYLGIPYAEAPIGPLRFKPPIPKTWSGELNAKELGPICPQPVFPLFPMGDDRPADEDCLVLDVFVPVSRPSKAAVLLWIHGGAYSLGTGTMPGLEAYPMAALGEVIVVAINYRLGALGFLTTGDEEVPGNMGMLDQIEAMKWVQEHIAAFGGDPDRVTIFGESAGAGSVGCHTVSPLSKGLYSGAIMQSGVANAPWAYTSDTENYAKRAFAIGELVNCTATDDGDTKQLVECLMDVSADDLANALERLPEILPEDPAALPFGPVVDGHFLLEAPSTLVEKGLFNPADMMVGFNADEGAITIVVLKPEATEQPHVNRTDFDNAIEMNKITALSGTLQQGAVEFVYFDESIYSDPETADYYDAASQIIGDVTFGCPASAYLTSASKAAVGQTYSYYFSHRPSVSVFNATWSGAGHGEELAFFGAHFLPDSGIDHTAEEVALASTMITYWTNFAKTGDPNMASEEQASEDYEPEWPQYTVNDPMYRELATTMRTGRGLKAKQCSLWNDYLPKLEAATAMKDQVCPSHYAAGDDEGCTDETKP